MLKKSWFIFLGLSLVIISCLKENEDFSFPQGSFSAEANGQFFNATSISATVDSGKISLTAIDDSNNLIISIIVNSSEAYKAYNTDTGLIAEAEYTIQTSNGNINYTTSQTSKSSGKVFIREIKCFESLISGSFYFTAHRPQGIVFDSIMVEQGYFYDIPFVNDGLECPDTATCDDGVQNGDETGIDCGGSCPIICDTSTTDTSVIDTSMIDTNNYSISATIDGAPLEIMDPNVTNTSGTVIVTATVLNTVLSVSFNESLNPGSYNSADGISAFNISYVTAGIAYIVFGNPVSITVTANDFTNKIMEGTFNGTLYNSTNLNNDSIIVTDGMFKINYE